MASHLFTPLRLRKLELPNRIVVSPMCQYSAVDGSATDWHLMHLGHLAIGGAGMLITEATAVERRGRITPGCLGLFSDENEAALGRVVQFIRERSEVPLAIQLSHAGRKASSRRPWDGGHAIAIGDGGWPTVAPSAKSHADGEPPPVAMDDAAMAIVREAFVKATRRAERLGFDAIEIHAAHGYLLHQFLSPIANERTDAYGGSLENRMRFPLEVFQAIREAWPADKPLGVRISATDWVDGGWDLEQSIGLAKALQARGCDWIDVSSGGISRSQQISLGPLYQVPFATQIRSEVGIMTMAVGLITEPAEAESIVRDGQADLVALARGFLAEPRWAWRAARELGGTVQGPQQYYRPPRRGAPEIFVGMRADHR
jgi:2,4-dienoyl-CoA reductase-like NADH-dependent reductase (Old Yellow Enzyme family)